MRILLTNDDGISAPGIYSLFSALDGIGELVPVAPATVQSATSHGVTYDAPLLTREVRVNDEMTGIAVEGRPADCVKVAFQALWPEQFGQDARPDLTISGMNTGANVGINIIYSGTVAAAVESAFLGVPAIAVSLHIGDPKKTCYERAAFFARTAIDRVLEHGIDPHSVININIPRTETENMPMPEIKVVAMNTAAGVDHYERRETPMGEYYYWATGSGMDFAHTTTGSDVEAIFEGCITVTPLTYSMTDYQRIETWRERLQGQASRS